MLYISCIKESYITPRATGSDKLLPFECPLDPELVLLALLPASESLLSDEVLLTKSDLISEKVVLTVARAAISSGSGTVTAVLAL